MVTFSYQTHSARAAGPDAPRVFDRKSGQPLNGGGRIGAELAVPLRGGLGIGAHQHACGQRRQRGGEGVGNVRPLNQRPAADGVDDTARAQKRIQRHGPNAGSGLVVMQRRIGMRAHVGR